MADDLVIITEVAKMVGRSGETLVQWDKWSDMEEEAGRQRLIPKPVKKGRVRYWSLTDIETIKRFIEGLRPGDMTRFNRMKYGKYK